MKTENSEIYSVLARVYDAIMSDVDYESWADFIDEIIQTHHYNPIEVMELACGTGDLSLSLSELDCYKLSASDGSAQMIDIARQKAAKQGAPIEFSVIDFEKINSDKKYDVVFSVFDSVNYLQTKEQLLRLFKGTQRILKPEGLFIFDFSTPKNSIEAVDYLNNDEGSLNNYRYFRESRYDVSNKMHLNVFEIDEMAKDGKTVLNKFREVHKQRIYSIKEMLSIVDQTSYHLIAKYKDFELEDADDNSARVTMVLKCQKLQ